MRNFLWIAAAGGLLAVAWSVDSPYMAFALHAFLLLIVLANLSSLAWLAGLDCERSISETMLQQGEETEVTVTVHNRRGWPIPWIYFEDRVPPGCELIGEAKRLAILMPGRSTTLRYRILAPRRGYHRVGPLLMESGDVFGLQRRFRTATRRDYFSVLPMIAYIETFSVASHRPQGAVRVSNKIYEDPTRINAIREYHPGDPLSSIHWKVTARTGELHVKTFEPSTVTGGTLVLDMHEESYLPEGREERLELAITTTASIAYLLQMGGEQLGMITNARDAAEEARYEVAGAEAYSLREAEAADTADPEGQRISPLSVMTRRSPIQAQVIAENLARVLPGHGLDAEHMLLNERGRLPRDAALLPVVGQVTGRFAMTLAAMKDQGFAVSVFFIKHQKGYEEAAALLAPHRIDVFHIEHERNLHELAPQRIGQYIPG